MGNKDAKVQCRIASLNLKSNLKREALLLAVERFGAFWSDTSGVLVLIPGARSRA